MIPFAIKSFCSAIFIIASIALMPGCTKKVDMTENTSPSTNMDTPKKYLALGDSYTIGQSVSIDERFPHLTTTLLKQENINIQEPEYIATTGWTTLDLQSAINARGALGIYDVVTLLIGVNDQYQHLDTGGYRKRFIQLLNRAVELSGNRPQRVFVLSIPDYSATPFVPAYNKIKVSEEIDQFNAINKQITIENKISYVDITPLTRAAANDASLIASDGLHYSGKEHKLWSEKLAPLIKNVLQ